MTGINSGKNSDKEEAEEPPDQCWSFSSINELIKKIQLLVAAYDKTKVPFNRTDIANSILEKLQRLCSQISETVH